MTTPHRSAFADHALTKASLLYRQPELYAQLNRDPDDTTTRLCETLIDTHGPSGASTVLDLGCGTGQDLGYLARRFDTVGVDVQPAIVDYARRTWPTLHIHLADLREFRLGRTVDALLCLGNTLAYLHGDADLEAGFVSFAAHAHPGTLLILYTLVAPIPAAPPKRSRVDCGDLHADAMVRYEWEPRTQISTLHRIWQLDDGAQVVDHIRRRVITPQQLQIHLARAGFDLLELFSDPAARDRGPTGPGAYAAARFTGDRTAGRADSPC